MIDCVENFLELFGNGRILEALQSIVYAPNRQYDALNSSHGEVLHAVVNYADAAAFASLYALSNANKYLRQVITHDRALWLRAQPALSLLEYEQTLLHFFNVDDQTFEASQTLLHPEMAHYISKERKGLPLKPDEIQAAVAAAPAAYRDCLNKRMLLGWNITRFCMQKPAVASYIKSFDPFAKRPWHVFHYPLPITAQPIPTAGEIPLIFLEPCQGDYTSFLHGCNEKRAVFAFEDCGIFFQTLQFPTVLDALCRPDHLIYLFDEYPNTQLRAQQWKGATNEIFQSIFFAEKPILHDTSALFATALKQCLMQSPHELMRDSDSANWLYAICKRFLFRAQEDRLGVSRAAALVTWTEGEAWIDSHKKHPPPDLPLGPPPQDYLERRLRSIAAQRKPRPLGTHSKIKLAHITPQVVEGGGHAPSRILDNLLTHYNRERFEVTLISSERLTLRLMEYPFNATCSPHSTKRAHKLLHRVQDSGVKVYVADSDLSYELTAKGIASILHHHEIDIAVFHGPDVINAFCAQMTDVPLRVLIEHGTMPAYPGFDMIFVSTEEALEIYQKQLKNLGAEAFALPFAEDVRMRWERRPPSREELGLPLNAFLMTTISNHLQARLGNEMRLAIAETLQRCPEAYYVPIGPVSPEEKESFQAFFSRNGVADRVIFLGHRANASQCARAMQLYLNEFPFGSCLGMLEAMAAGCPVVTMYDVNGPQQARYGGSYFGVDKAIRTGSIEDYVSLACRLIKDKAFYKDWSEHAVHQYAKHVDTQSYVATFESILENAVKCIKANGSENTI